MKKFVFKNQTFCMIKFSLIMLVLSSCSPVFYFQLYDVSTSESLPNQDQFIFDYSDISIKYDFWADEGKSDFTLVNKTNQDIYIDLKSTHIILNGYAITYYQNIIFTTATNTAISTTYYYPYLYYSSGSYSTASGNSIMEMPEEMVCIPANSSKKIKGFRLNETLYYDCDYALFPSKKQIKTQKFSLDDSPMTIRNIISYSFNKYADSLIRVEHDFWVSGITNYPRPEIIESRNLEYCGQKSASLQDYFLKASPKMFYLKYTASDTPWK